MLFIVKNLFKPLNLLSVYDVTVQFCFSFTIEEIKRIKWHPDKPSYLNGICMFLFYVFYDYEFKSRRENGGLRSTDTLNAY